MAYKVQFMWLRGGRNSRTIRMKDRSHPSNKRALRLSLVELKIKSTVDHADSDANKDYQLNVSDKLPKIFFHRCCHGILVRFSSIHFQCHVGGSMVHRNEHGDHKCPVVGWNNLYLSHWPCVYQVSLTAFKANLHMVICTKFTIRQHIYAGIKVTSFSLSMKMDKIGCRVIISPREGLPSTVILADMVSTLGDGVPSF